MPSTSFRAFLPTFQIFAANTGVGKTLFSAALCRAAVKTSLTSAERAWAGQGGVESRKVFYIKPVQTGYPEDSDQRHVQSYCPEAATQTIFKYKEPAGAHLCAVQENRPVSDGELLTATRAAVADAWTDSAKSRTPGIVFLETAGGVTSPVMSGTPQATAFRPLRYPTVLIGDSNLGGVSTTLSAYESLILRGYDVEAVLMFHNAKYRNHDALREQIPKGVPMHVFPSPPELPLVRSGAQGLEMDQRLQDATNMMVWYEGTERAENVIEDLLASHERRLSKLEGMATNAESKVWWPFTQHTMVGQTTVIDSAHNDAFTLYTPLSQSSDASQAATAGTTHTSYDACASWWTQSVGHANHELTLAAANAASRYGHVIFPECIHEPAMDLAESLTRTVGKGWAERVFFSDNGSTGMEVAIKAALKVVERALIEKGEWTTGRARKELGIVGIDGGYHGDTIGAMDAASPNVYNDEINWYVERIYHRFEVVFCFDELVLALRYKPRGIWFQPPSVMYKSGRYTVRIPSTLADHKTSTPESFESLPELFEFSSRSPAQIKLYEDHITRTLREHLASGRPLGALLIEPILLGAGGMILVDPLFQHVLIRVVRSLATPLPVIYDEVFVGFHRLGLGLHSPGSQLLGHLPDVACYAKNMSGGLVPTAATVVSKNVYGAFEGTAKTDALLHGHSYTAAPIGCRVAASTLQMYDRMVHGCAKTTSSSSSLSNAKLNRHSLPGTLGPAIWSSELVDRLSHLASVDGLVCLGSVLAIELAGSDKGYTSASSGDIVRQLRQRGVFARPLGNVVYIMSPYIAVEASGPQRQGVEAVIKVLEEVFV
ncbi:hypothetical protein HKX48_000401 [Thoreauomyces humboldtii]|nr:hypothetical protein HKX48_000401 [Thoreauomyces humboldtii]